LKYDSIILDEGGTPEGGHRGTAIVPVNPEQIKSATGNRGTFDAKNPDIRFMPASDAGAENSSPAVQERARKLWMEKGTESPFFKRWFGESKVVDDDGKPMVAYHGTPRANFSEFDTSRQGRDSGWYGTGSYFTLRPSEVGGYTTDGTTAWPKEGAGVYKVYLKSENPLRVENRNDMANQIQKMGGNPNLEGKALTKELQRLGFDGVITHDGGEAVIFKPEQVKSATGNTGTFDAKNPDIRFMPSDAGGGARAARWSTLQGNRSWSITGRMTHSQSFNQTTRTEKTQDGSDRDFISPTDQTSRAITRCSKTEIIHRLFPRT